MPSKVDLRLRPAPGVGDSDIAALLPRDRYGQHGEGSGPEPHGRWLLFRIIGSDRVEAARALAAAALDSGLVSDAEVHVLAHAGGNLKVHTERARPAG